MSLELRNEYKRALGRSRERAFEAHGRTYGRRHTQESTARGEQRLEKQKRLNRT